MSEKGYAYKTISNWKRSLKAAFYTAIEDDCIRKNPFNFAMDTVLEDDTEEKVALTQEQEDRLLAFAGSDPVYRKYCDEIIILLGTGLRISELCGLTVDLDFENRRIDVDHQLLRDSELGYYVDAPKTKNGVRQIPMSEKVYQALKAGCEEQGQGRLGQYRGLHQLPVPQPKRSSQNGVLLREHVPGACQEVQQAPQV